MFLAKESPIVDSVHPNKRSKKKKAWYRNPLSGKNKSTKLDVLCCLNKKNGERVPETTLFLPRPFIVH